MNLKFEPLSLTEAARQIVLALILFNIIHWDVAQTTGFLMAFSAALTMIARAKSVPVAIVELAGASATQLKAAAESPQDHVLVAVPVVTSSTAVQAATLNKEPQP